jgi:Domain of unknown function (DUF4326)
MSLSVVNGKLVGFENGIYVGRKCAGLKGSVLGNPFVIGKDGSREEVIKKYRAWLWAEVWALGEVWKELRRIKKLVEEREDVQLVCWCGAGRCHGDVIKSCVLWMIKEDL